MNPLESYDIKPITPQALQAFYDSYPEDKTFLQSAPFGAWRESVGEKIHYLGIFIKPSPDSKTHTLHSNPDCDHLIGTALLQHITSRFKTYLHCPHGPLIPSGNINAWESFLKAYKALGESEKVDLIRVSPLLPLPDTENQMVDLTKHQFIPAATHLVNPEHTLVLDITQSEEDILAQMRKSTRYEIRRIEKVGIKVTQGHTQADLDVFWDLHTQTVVRQRFVPFPLSYTKAQIKAFGPECLIFNASIDQKYYSSSIILFDKKSAYYHQGASIYSRLPCSHATIWQAILEAKARGCTQFNFWGIVGDEAKKHPWYGLSKFKKGFGGHEKHYLHVHDHTYTLKGQCNRLIETWRKWRKGY